MGELIPLFGEGDNVPRPTDQKERYAKARRMFERLSSRGPKTFLGNMPALPSSHFPESGVTIYDQQYGNAVPLAKVVKLKTEKE